jgi:polar amino acid transport system substrate-binding protein
MGFPLLAILAAVMTIFSPAAADDGIYRVGILDFPPYAVMEKSGACKGILVGVLERVLKQGGISYTMKGFPQKRLFSNLATGETDIYMGIKGVPDYEGKVLFSTFPVAGLDLRVYFRKVTPAVQNIEQLKGARVIVIMGYGYGGLIKYLENPANKIAVDPSHTHTLAFRKLKAGRADYLLDYQLPASIAIEEAGVKDVRSHSISKVDSFFIVSRKTPGADELMKPMETAYQSLKSDGTLSNGPRSDVQSPMSRINRQSSIQRG